MMEGTTSEGAPNRGRGGGSSDEPEREETPECESDFYNLSIRCFEFFCEFSSDWQAPVFQRRFFLEGFSRFGSDFSAMERAFD